MNVSSIWMGEKVVKKSVPVLFLILVFAVLFCLPGCAQGDQQQPQTQSQSENQAEEAEAKAAFVGKWELVEMSQNGTVTGKSDIDSLREMGLDVYVELSDDMSLVLYLLGETMTGTWEAVDSTTGTLTIEGQQLEMSINGPILSFEQDGAALSFMKSSDADASAVVSSSPNSSSTGDDFAIVDSGYDDARGKGYKGSDGNYYYENNDGTYEATDGKGNGVKDTDGDGKPDEYTTDSGKTWHKY